MYNALTGVSKSKRTALITGAYGGLGTRFADIHAASGGELILVGRDQAKLDAQAKEIEKNTMHRLFAWISGFKFVFTGILPVDRYDNQ